MSGRVQITGLDELRRFMADAKDEIRAEAMTIVRDATEHTAAEMRGRLPTGPTGNLKAGVKTVYPVASEIVGVALSSAPHAHLVEFGTKERRTKSGAKRGKMPGYQVTPFFAQRNRSKMMSRLITMIRRFGFEVNGA